MRELGIYLTKYLILGIVPGDRGDYTLVRKKS